ncbi:MAG: DUF4625 domain-containing protein [Crocinitomix sp.]|nr:DUF4625 domain-containing protein [Crocinitomix sp.]
MKYSRKITVILAIAALSFTSTSCKKDKEDPTITVSTPAQHSHFNWGDEVHIEADFADDRGLKDYAVMMVDADGNHLSTIDFMKTGTTSELTYEFHEHFVVPDSAPMMAWVQFTVTDAEDKAATLEWMLHFDM